MGKIEIDLNEIFCDGENVNESIKRQVIENLTGVIKENIGKNINNQISKLIDEQIREAIKVQMPSIVNDLINTEYVMVDKWGDSTRQKTTFRQQLIKAMHESMVYEKKNYDSDKNVFTKAVDSVINENIELFKSNFNKIVNDLFVKETLEFATNKLREKLNIK